MRKMSKFLILGFVLVLILLMPLHAQTAANAPADSNAAENPTPPGQAPAEMTKKIADLVHAGKYPEALKLTTGLLVAYPDDQRLIKAKALIDKILSPADPASTAPAGSANAAPASNRLTNNGAAAQPAPNMNAESLAGMERVDYSALIVLARQAQQTTDLSEQKTLLHQFMDQSGVFLQKHPDQMLLWQLRAASAISLNDPLVGYEAGQKLLAADAADSNDPNLQSLLGQLKNKGWLDKQGVMKQAVVARSEWVLGVWSVSWSLTDKNGHVLKTGNEHVAFSRAESDIEGYIFHGNKKLDHPLYFSLRINVLDTGEIRCEHHKAEPVWEPLSCEAKDQNRAMTIVYPTNEEGNTYSWSLHRE
jgi:hypothetical protein